MYKTNKDILIGLINTLNDNDCRDVYYFIIDKEYDKSTELFKYKTIQLTERQYSKLLWMWGKDKTYKCMDILVEWLSRQTLRKKISHYKQLIGWVERAYYQKYDVVKDKSVDCYIEIDSKWKAIKYIKSIPKQLRAIDAEVIWLVNKFDIDINSME